MRSHTFIDMCTDMRSVDVRMQSVDSTKNGIYVYEYAPKVEKLDLWMGAAGLQQAAARKILNRRPGRNK